VFKKQSKLFFYNFVNFLPTLIIFGVRMTKMIELCNLSKKTVQFVYNVKVTSWL